MSHNLLRPPDRPSERPSVWQNELLTIVAFVAVLLLIGLIGLVWGSWGRVALVVTPTPTATEASTVTATPDIRATQIANELLTKVALLVTPEDDEEVGTATPIEVEIPSPELTVTATHSITIMLPDISIGVTLTATPTITPTQKVTVILPLISGNVTMTPTTTIAPGVPLSVTATVTPGAPLGVTPTVAITLTPTITVTPTVTPTLPPTLTPTPTLSPTPSPTFGPTPTPTPFTIAELKGFVRASGVTMRRGPSHLYESTKTLGGNVQVQLLGRDQSGEWLYVCCQDNEHGWVRQVDALPRDNPRPEGKPDDFNPNDVRWLRVEPHPSGLAVPPISPAIPPGTFPLYRYDRTNQARLPTFPIPPLGASWPARERAQGEMLSPAIVSSQAVIAASDDFHLYTFRKSNGDQRWRLLFEGQKIRTAPAIRDSLIYVATDGGVVHALEDFGNSADERWQKVLDVEGKRLTPIDGINMLGETLFLSANNAADQYFVALKRGNGEYQFSPVRIEGNSLRYPAIGYQLAYVGGQTVTAIDVHDGTIVWRQDQIPDEADRINNVTAPPVYSSPGVAALSELYVADSSGAIYALDANTGRKLWRQTSSDVTTGLAVGPSMLFASGENFLKAVSRENGEERWRLSIGSRIVAGPFVSGESLLIVTNAGNVELRNTSNGEPSYSLVIGTNVLQAPAIAVPYIFIPSSGKTLRAIKGAE